jgi:hypothetical protein
MNTNYVMKSDSAACWVILFTLQSDCLAQLCVSHGAGHCAGKMLSVEQRMFTLNTSPKMRICHVKNVAESFVKKSPFSTVQCASMTYRIAKNNEL